MCGELDTMVQSTRKEKTIKYKKFTIDLNGPEGNAYFLIGIARNLAKQLGQDADRVTNEMQQGDYDHLLTVFKGHFGEHVDLIERRKEYDDT